MDNEFNPVSTIPRIGWVQVQINVAKYTCVQQDIHIYLLSLLDSQNLLINRLAVLT